MKTKHIYFLFLLLISFFVDAQKGKWVKSTFIEGTQGVYLQNLNSKYYSVFNIDLNVIKRQLLAAPLRSKHNIQSNTIVSFPDEKGRVYKYRVVEVPVLASNIGELYPNIKTYLGSRTDNSGTRIRFSITPLGLNAMLSIPGEDNVYIQPVTKTANGQYLVYNRKSKKNNTNYSFECLVDAVLVKEKTKPSTSRDANDQLLRTFRIAISVTGEYTQFWNDGNDTNGTAQEDALAQVVSTLNRTNEVYEADMAITFLLINGIDYNGNTLIFETEDTDVYTGDFNSELQMLLDTAVGDADYDIGHLFTFGINTGDAGCIGCVCGTNKGSGFSSHSFTDNDGGPYMSDFFDIDFVPHEIGHQMGGNHTFSNETEGTGVNSEPGSGTTIMGYAGITGPNDVQNHSDPYFHYHTINQILNNVTNLSGNCAVTTSISNNPPVANAGADFAIPNGTAFVLSGLATDLDQADVLTYTWEQIDSGQTTVNQFGPNHLGPVWRSRPPSTNTDRFMPIFGKVLAGELTEQNPVQTLNNTSWETVSTIKRILNFGLTVRDRSPANGIGQVPQTSFDTMSVSVQDGLPFTVFTPPAWGSGSTQTVSWNVGETNKSPINCNTVNIKFSIDGGLTFPTILASASVNDGSALITVPSIADNDNVRLLIEANDNIFYAVSDVFSISNSPSFAINNTSGSKSVCNLNLSSFIIDFFTVNEFNETVTFIANGNPLGSTVTFTSETLQATGETKMDIDGLTNADPGNYIITVTASSASITKQIDVALTVVDSLCSSVADTDFQTSTTLVQFQSINNASAKSLGYSDYKTISTNVNRESSYPITVNQNTEGAFICYTTVWIDWNQNCILEASEAYDLGTAEDTLDGPTSNSGLTILVPSDAILGATIMRVSTKYNATSEACENSFDGEVEDYTIIVNRSLNAIEANTILSIFPNPSNGSFTVNLSNTSESEIQINVFDIRGRKIFGKNYPAISQFNETLKLDEFQSGMYLLYVVNGSYKKTKKILIN